MTVTIMCFLMPCTMLMVFKGKLDWLKRWGCHTKLPMSQLSRDLQVEVCRAEAAVEAGTMHCVNIGSSFMTTADLKRRTSNLRCFGTVQHDGVCFDHAQAAGYDSPKNSRGVA